MTPWAIYRKAYNILNPRAANGLQTAAKQHFIDAMLRTTKPCAQYKFNHHLIQVTLVFVRPLSAHNLAREHQHYFVYPLSEMLHTDRKIMEALNRKLATLPYYAPRSLADEIELAMKEALFVGQTDEP